MFHLPSGFVGLVELTTKVDNHLQTQDSSEFESSLALGAVLFLSAAFIHHPTDQSKSP